MNLYKKIKERPSIAFPSGHPEFFGADYMICISKPDAVKLCDPIALPKVGWEILVEANQEGRLAVCCLAGSYFARSSTTPVKDWAHSFAVEVVRLKGKK